MTMAMATATATRIENGERTPPEQNSTRRILLSVCGPSFFVFRTIPLSRYNPYDTAVVVEVTSVVVVRPCCSPTAIYNLLSLSLSRIDEAIQTKDRTVEVIVRVLMYFEADSNNEYESFTMNPSSFHRLLYTLSVVVTT
jgi:hypothetical protein